MTVTSTPIFAQTPWTKAAALQNGTNAYTFAAAQSAATNLVSLVAGGTNGSLVEAINVTSSDTSARDLVLVLYNGTYNFPLMTISIPATAGFTNSIPVIDLFRNAQSAAFPIDVNGNRYLYIPSGSTLYVGTLTQITSAKQINVTAVGADY